MFFWIQRWIKISGHFFGGAGKKNGGLSARIGTRIGLYQKVLWFLRVVRMLVVRSVFLHEKMCGGGRAPPFQMKLQKLEDGQIAI